VQSSLWAQVKAVLGWRATRIVVMGGEDIVAGAQILMRPLPLAGVIGYVPKGPLFAYDDPVLAQLVFDELRQVAKAHRIQYLVVQPSGNGETEADQMSNWGFKPCSMEQWPTATVAIDLAKDLDVIMTEMKSKTRYNIRLGERQEITVREAAERDLPTFHRMLRATGQRQQFDPYPLEYFSEMWRMLEPPGYLKLFIAEYQGEALSALLAVPFGDTVIYKKGGWSGRHGKLRPNEVMHWTAIKWAKAQGYRYYDFEGIDPKVARALLKGAALPDSATQTLNRFKLGFGGQVTLLPGVYCYVHNPFLRLTYNTLFTRIEDWSITQNTINRVRTGA
jgi:lipid II:glycine glycyltransferase (peptidoglycan interpeptide bridge formation enzyme)